MVSFVESVVSTFVGKGSFFDFGDRYPDLDGNNMSSVSGLYVIGNVAGTPDIRAALNAGSDLGRFMKRGDGLPPIREQCDYDVVIIGAGPGGCGGLERASIFDPMRIRAAHRRRVELGCPQLWAFNT